MWEKTKNITKRLVGISVEGRYSFDGLGVTPEGGNCIAIEKEAAVVARHDKLGLNFIP